MRSSKIPITVAVVFATTTSLTAADLVPEESLLFPSDSFEISLGESRSGTNWDLFGFDSATPSPPYAANFLGELTADHPPEDSTADYLLGDSSFLQPSIAELDTLNNPVIFNNEPDGSFFDASSDIFASLPADVEAKVNLPGRTDEAGCTESKYPVDLCCNGPVGAIIDEDNGVRIYSRIRDCSPSESAVIFRWILIFEFLFLQKRLKEPILIVMIRANRLLYRMPDSTPGLLRTSCCCCELLIKSTVKGPIN